MPLRHLLFFVLCLVCATVPAIAQQTATLSLSTDTTSLQTGQEYVVTISINGAPDTWSNNLEMAFDPKQLYIIGTRSGSPVRQGDFFAPGDSSVVVRNSVSGNRLIYTISLLAPAPYANGSGVIGTFRIHPLQPGTTQITFHQIDLTVAYLRDGKTVTEDIPFTPVMLELNITGDPVEPPTEATATPPPTETPMPFTGPQIATEEPGLINVTAAPVTPTPLAAPAADNTPLLAVAIGAMVIGAVGLLAVLMLWRRSRR